MARKTPEFVKEGDTLYVRSSKGREFTLTWLGIGSARDEDGTHFSLYQFVSGPTWVSNKGEYAQVI